MHSDGEIESVEETLSAGSARIEASRRLLDHLDRRLSRGSQLLGDGDDDRSELDDSGSPERASTD